MVIITTIFTTQVRVPMALLEEVICTDVDEVAGAGAGVEPCTCMAAKIFSMNTM
jgi:hypothetical protein